MEAHTAPPDLRAIVSRLGGDLYAGASAALVPGPGHSRKDRSLSLKVTDDGRLIWCSHANDEPAKVWAHLGIDRGHGREMTRAEANKERAERQRLAKAEQARKLEFCRAVWAETVPAIGSPVEVYLRSRGVIGAIPQTLRFHAAAPMDYDARSTAPAMVAIATAQDGKSAAGLHVTAIRPDGSGKAAMNNPRRMFGTLAGAVVQLGPIPDDRELAIAEGIETALSYRDLTGTTTWAGLSTSGLRGFIPPPGLKRLVIAADGDDAGVDAARALAERASRRCECVVMPAAPGTDWNDALKGDRQ